MLDVTFTLTPCLLFLCSDVDDAMDAVRTTTDLVKELDSPTTVSSDAKLSMIQAALSAATARTGKSGETKAII